jgi:hypothetical protein
MKWPGRTCGGRCWWPHVFLTDGLPSVCRGPNLLERRRYRRGK